MSLRDIIVLGLILGSVPFCFFRPFYGIVLWTIIAFLNPEKFAWGMARDFPVALVVAIPTLLGFGVFAFRVRRLFCWEMFFAAVLWIWFTATAFNSAHEPMFAEKAEDAWFRWGMVSKIMLMAAVTVAVVNTWERLRWFALSIAGSFGLLVLKTLPFMVITGGAFRVYGPANSMIADNNDFGLALNMVLPFFFFLAKTETNRWLKRLMVFLFLATFPAILFTYSRGALVGLIAVSLCMLLQVKQKALLIPVAVVVFVFAAFFTPQAWRNRMNADNALDASARSRLNAWSYSWELAKDHPMMGGGFEAFTPALFARYAPNPRDVHGPHSIYFGVLAEHGFVGLFLYLSLVASCFFGLFRAARRARFYGDQRSLNYANMLEFSLIGFMVSGAFLGRAYFDFYFSIVAAVAILRQLCREEWASPHDPEEGDETPGEVELPGDLPQQPTVAQ